MNWNKNHNLLSFCALFLFSLVTYFVSSVHFYFVDKTHQLFTFLIDSTYGRNVWFCHQLPIPTIHLYFSYMSQRDIKGRITHIFQVTKMSQLQSIKGFMSSLFFEQCHDLVCSIIKIMHYLLTLNWFCISCGVTIS